MKRSRSVVFGLLCAILSVAASAWASPGERAVGSTHWVGSQYFQYLGLDAAGRELWLYPHLDGVFEVFTAQPDGWAGCLDSSYDPLQGRFQERFSAVERLNELLAKGTSKSEKRRAARLLALFVSLHPAEGGPYYLEPGRRALRKHLGAEGEAWVTASRQSYDALLARIGDVGTRILPEPAALRSSDDHYQALVGDGYLDVAVVGGNSEDKETGEFHSAGMVAELLDSLRPSGFKVSQRDAVSNQTLCERTVRLFDRSVRVRVRLTAAGREGAPARRSVANFVEGLARADVVIYFGHSNEGSGYYLSESRSGYSRFRIGASRKGTDLGTKCYGMGKKAHQIIALQSCLSYERYCAPIRAFYDQDPASRAPGLVGTSDKALMEEFAPRFAKFIELLARGAGPRELARDVNAIRHGPKTPELLFRGVLQPRHSFVVPQGVTIGAIEERGPKEGFVVKGTGSDGVVYDSTGVFPQDRPGEIVQVVAQPQGVYGVSRDGRLLSVSHRTEGAQREVVVPHAAGPRIVFAAWGKWLCKARLYLLDSEGGIRYLSRKADRLISPRHDPLPAGVRFVALGNTGDGRFVALDDAGRALVSTARRWEPLAGQVDLVATPSLACRDAELVFAD